MPMSMHVRSPRREAAGCSRRVLNFSPLRLPPGRPVPAPPPPPPLPLTLTLTLTLPPPPPNAIGGNGAERTEWCQVGRRPGPFPLLGAESPLPPLALIGLDTALHITVLLHGLYVGVVTTWLHWHNQSVGSHWHDQMLI
jgi:hypothetical protein